jgi:hypothetical protein
MSKLYRQYPETFIEDSDHYFKHVSAMTGESLHAKSKIAAELAFRDSKIAELEKERDLLLAFIIKRVPTIRTMSTVSEISRIIADESDSLLEAHNLEQQAKGAKDAWDFADMLFGRKNLSMLSPAFEVFNMVNSYSGKMRAKAKALKEQDK